jgi:hypothetical protein
LHFYDEKTVDQDEFDRVLEQSHFIWNPSVLNTVLEDGVEETYGKSISSGNLFDVIRNAKPFIIPAELNIDHPLEQSCFRYNSETEIAAFLANFFRGGEDYSQLAQRAITASLAFTAQNVRERNKDLFLR